jgi:hypothetical protein
MQTYQNWNEYVERMQDEIMKLAITYQPNEVAIVPKTDGCLVGWLVGRSVGILFYDAFSVDRLYNVDYRVT